MKKNLLKIAHFTSYLPKRCGIATYSAALQKSISMQTTVRNYTIAIDNIKEGYVYPRHHSFHNTEVVFNFWDKDKKGYIKAAKVINKLDADIVDVQHEFGLYGSRVKPETLGQDDGKNILIMLEKINKPIITTMHMVYKNPPKHHVEVVRNICKISKKIVVLSKISKYLLTKDKYKIDPNKIDVIPHGAPNVTKISTSNAKEIFGFSQKDFIVSSFGYIRSKKGYEYLIKAVGELKNEFPQIKLLIIGEVHPQRSPEYYAMLKGLVKKYKLEKRIQFINKFVDYSELLNYLMATNVFVAPFLVLDQVSSGTLIYAMAVGDACIATPFDYAKEALADKRGILVPVKDSKAIAKAIRHLIRHPKARHIMERKAYKYARKQTWSITAKKYIDLFQGVIDESSN